MVSNAITTSEFESATLSMTQDLIKSLMMRITWALDDDGENLSNPGTEDSSAISPG
jgi:hypothetical protein